MGGQDENIEIRFQGCGDSPPMRLSPNLNNSLNSVRYERHNIYLSVKMLFHFSNPMVVEDPSSAFNVEMLSIISAP
jgi:hypothetical protein